MGHKERLGNSKYQPWRSTTRCCSLRKGPICPGSKVADRWIVDNQGSRLKWLLQLIAQNPEDFLEQCERHGPAPTQATAKKGQGGAESSLHKTVEHACCRTLGVSPG